MKFRSTEEVDKIQLKLWKYIERPKRILESFIINLCKLDNAFLIQREADRCRGEIVLDHFNIVRLIGWTDQEKEDYYWLLLTRNKQGDLQIVKSSCVGSPLRLRGKLETFDYWSLDHLANLNFLTIENGLQLCKEKNIVIK